MIEIGSTQYEIFRDGGARWSKRSVSNLLWDLLAWVRIPSLQPPTTSQQTTQLSILPKSVNKYSEVTLKAQGVVLQSMRSLRSCVFNK